jgi:hypothetical protein
MRPSIAAVPLLASALVGCADPSPMSPTSNATVPSLGAAAQRSGTSRPFTGSCVLTFNPPPLPLPPVLHQVDTGTCHLTHLGQTDFYGEQDINFGAGTQSGWRRLTAANGDELYFTHVGTSAPAGPGLVRFVAQMTFTGGTGRFAGATGSAQGTGMANLITRSSSVTIAGTINY